MTRLDVVIFGATGFTGKNAVLEMVRLARQHPGLTWGVAGRSQSRLEDLMRTVAETTGEDLSHVKIIVADVSDEPSLKQMCCQAHVVANCCGPYRLYGEPVVRAAVAARAHHVDVSGEPQFIETMVLKYQAAAQEAGVYVISACGFDSIPNDMGVVYLQENFGGTLNSVESYMSTDLPAPLRAEARAHGAVHYGTWESLVHGLAHWGELKSLRQKMFPEKLPPSEPKLLPRRVVHWAGGAWAVPFPGADNSIVRRTQRALAGARRPAQFRAYVQLEGLLQALLLLLAAALIAVMANFKWTRNLLLQHPRLFSCGLVSRSGPSRAVQEGTSFQFLLYGEGWAEGSDLSKPMDKRVVAKVSGVNPGYGATVAALLRAAVTVLRQADRMPGSGGVLTTGVAFKNTDLIKDLNENGMKFEIVETTAI